MDAMVKIVNDQLICVKYDHNQQIISVVVDNQIPLKDKFLCSKCLETHQNVSKIMAIKFTIANIKERIAKKNLKYEEEKKESLLIIKQFCFNMNNLKSKVIQQFDEIQTVCQLWITDLENLQQKDDLINIIKEVEQFKQNKDEEKINIQEMNQSYYKKLTSTFIKLQENKIYQDFFDILKKIIQQEQINQNELKQIQVKEINKPKVSQVQFIQSLKQTEEPRTMAFNNSKTIMVQGCNKNIVIWTLDYGKIRDEKLFQRHTDLVCCLVYSKKQDWFFSGSRDSTVRCWKKQYNNEWICGNTVQKHLNWVLCLVLNNYENQLISCGADSNIIVWKINYQVNQLDYDYTVEKKHSDYVYGISLNESETALVSCSYDKQIILWIKDSNNKWSYLHHISYDDYGYRISFINDSQIVWQQKSRGISYIFQIENDQLIHQPQLSIELSKDSQDNWLFPTIYNISKQIIIQKYNKYVYILQQQEDGKLNLSSEPIYQNNNSNYGTLTNDGECLVLWEKEKKEYTFYNIQYK